MLRYSLLTIFSFFCLLTNNLYGQQRGSNLHLRYDHPATIWEEALPLGNGKTGVMVFGHIDKERFQLNDNTLWSGYPDPGNNPNGPKYLPLLRKAVQEGDYALAEHYWKKMQGPYSARYLPMANLYLDFNLKDTLVSDYERTLDLGNAIASVSFRSHGVHYKREILTSHPDKLMMVRLTASKKKKISFITSMDSKLRFATSSGDGMLMLNGKAPLYVAHRESDPLQVVYDVEGGEGMSFNVLLKVQSEGGRIHYSDSTIKVEGADAATLYLSAATSFNGFNKSPGLQGKEAFPEAVINLNEGLKKNYKQLRENHISDYQLLFNRVKFSVGEATKSSTIATDERLIRFNSGIKDDDLIELYYQFGRYLLISCSRQGAPPANLQGMWNDHVQPPWGSNYTTNINTEMNYWLAESTNLSECHEPLLQFIKNLSINGCADGKSELWNRGGLVCPS